MEEVGASLAERIVPWLQPLQNAVLPALHDALLLTFASAVAAAAAVAADLPALVVAEADPAAATAAGASVVAAVLAARPWVSRIGFQTLRQSFQQERHWEQLYPVVSNAAAAVAVEAKTVVAASAANAVGLQAGTHPHFAILPAAAAVREDWKSLCIIPQHTDLSGPTNEASASILQESTAKLWHAGCVMTSGRSQHVQEAQRRRWFLKHERPGLSQDHLLCR